MNKDPDYLVRSDWIDGTPVVITKARFPGLTKEHLAPHLDDPNWIVSKLNNKMTVERLEDDEDGNIQVHYGVGTPMMISNRSMFMTYFIERDPDSGISTTMASSRGTEKLAEKHASVAGKNVVGDMII